jgi:shikimate kinase
MAQSGDSPILLIGYRGTGKTAVARELAARLGYDWADADDVIEKEAGKTIAQIFADEGEAAFRDREASVVAALSCPWISSRPGGKRRTVVALGGGAVLREDNRRVICGAGPVVWLTASVDTILKRLAADATTASRRPNLTTVGGRAEIEALLAERTPLYRQCATLVVDTEGKTAAEVAEEIAANL